MLLRSVLPINSVFPTFYNSILNEMGYHSDHVILKLCRKFPLVYLSMYLSLCQLVLGHSKVRAFTCAGARACVQVREQSHDRTDYEM